MARSMTGFGRAESVTDSRRITVEIKSVNHRYLDLSVKMPRKLSFLEGQIRSLMKSYAVRGKVDVYLTYEDYSAGSAGLKYDAALAAQYLTYMKQMSEGLGLPMDVGTATLARFPEIFSMQEQSLNEEELWQVLEGPLREACTRFAASRIQEGEHLKQDLLEKLRGLDEKVTLVQERSPQVVEEYREKLENKVKELLEGASVDDSRIAAEVIIFADKICNDEETVRLRSHIQGMTRMLEQDEALGRKLDFLAQEMNREANTILSKSSDLEVSNIAIDLKTEIEKIREQVQNIE